MTYSLHVNATAHLHEGVEVRALLPERGEKVVIMIQDSTGCATDLWLFMGESEIALVQEALRDGKQKLTARQNSPDIRTARAEGGEAEGCPG